MAAMAAMDPNERAKLINTMSHEERVALAIAQSAREAAERAAAERAARAAAHEHAMFVQGHAVQCEADRPAVVERAFRLFTAAEVNTQRLDVSRKLEEAVKQKTDLERENASLRQQLDNATKLIESLLVSDHP